MKRRPPAQAPDAGAVDRGDYDAAFLLGAYQDLYLARASSRAMLDRAASGGVLTQALAALLQAGEIDGALCVGFAPGDPLTPRYLVCTDEQSLMDCAGSVYAYMPWTGLRDALDANKGKRLAVVSQPCHIPALRRRQKDGRDDIRFIAGFFCGWNMGLEATGYLLSKTGIRPEDVAEVRYRGGGWPGGFTVQAKDGRKTGFGKEAYELVNMQFVRPGCFRCPRYMAEEADLSCGDAWLREQQELTAVLVRSEAGRKALSLAREQDRVRLFELPEPLLVRMHLHNLRYKKYGLGRAMRLITWVFNKALPKSWAPFTLLVRLSAWRRSRKIGVSLPQLQPKDIEQGANHG